MHNRNRYHIIVDSLENVEEVKSLLERSSLSDIKTWNSFPLLLSASLTTEQSDWIRNQPNIVAVEKNTTTYLHEQDTLWELILDPQVDLAVLRADLLMDFNVQLMTSDTQVDKIWLQLDQQQYLDLMDLIGAGQSEYSNILEVNGANKRREYSRVQDLNRSNWGIERISHRSTKFFEQIRFTENGSYNGNERVLVYIVDSGMLAGHDEYRGRMHVDQFDAFRDIGDPLYGQPDTRIDVDGATVLVDDHGTHVASIVGGSTVGVAPGCALVNVRAFSEFETSTTTDLLDAIDWVIQHYSSQTEPGIVNMSLAFDDITLGSQWLGEIITGSLIQAGLVTVVSAGNGGTDAYQSSPANAGSKRELVQVGSDYYLETQFDYQVKPITVGATVRPAQSPSGNDEIWGSSNWGDVVDIFAPGVNIFGASLQIVNGQVDLSRKGSYSVKSGTSMAAPHVAGTCALHLANDRTLTHSQLRTILREQSTKSPFATASVAHDRVDPPRYVDVGGNQVQVDIKNKIVYSPNILLYAWFTLTDISWPEQEYDFVVDELSSHEFNIKANSSDYYGDPQIVRYTFRPIDVPVVFPNNFPIFYYTSDNLRLSGNIMNIENTAVIRTNAPAVTQHEIGYYEIEAYDGRIRSYRRVSIGVENLPNPPVWVSPNAGELLVTPAIKGESFDSSTLQFIATHVDNFSLVYSIIPTSGALPPGLFLQQDPGSNVAYLQGTITYVPNDNPTTTYEFLIRVTASNGLIAERLFSLTVQYVNEQHWFRSQWLTSMYEIEPGIRYFGPTYVGNSYFKQIDVVNPDNDPLTYEVQFIPGITEDATTFNGVLPAGLSVNNQGEVVGIVDPTANLGSYYFRISVSDPSGYEIHQDFLMRALSALDDGFTESDQIIWITPPGLLGSIYETFPSHVQVEARNPTGVPVQYVLAPGSLPLPEGLYVQTTTGYIMGKAPMIPQTATYNFTIRAIVGSRFVDRTFSITIISQYDSTNIMNFRARITGSMRMEIENFVRNTTNVPIDNLFRYGDPNFGLPNVFDMYVLGGAKKVSPMEIMCHLRDYHHRMDLTFGPITWAKVVDPSGFYVYDVVLMSVVDPMAKAGGFLPDGQEEILTTVQEYPYVNPFDEPCVGFPDPNQYLEGNRNRFYPNSLHNAREDLISTVDGRNGIGLDGQEGLPMWMRTVSDTKKPPAPLGFTPAVILAYAKPGKGLITANSFVRFGLQSQFMGRVFTVDRYFVADLLLIDTTRFDVLDGEQFTIFDDPDLIEYPLPNFPPPLNPLPPAPLPQDLNYREQFASDLSGVTTRTLFDVDTIETGKYYKFEDDLPILKDRDNPYR